MSFVFFCFVIWQGTDPALSARSDELAVLITTAMADREFSYLRSLISEAKGCGMSQGPHAALIRSADNVLTKLRFVMEIDMNLVGAIKTRDIDTLNVAIKRVESAIQKDSSFTPPASYRQALSLVDELVGQVSVVDALKIAIEKKDKDTLEKILRTHSEGKGGETNLPKRIVDEAKIILDRLENHSKVLIALQEANTVSSLRSALDRAMKMGVSDSDLQIARAKYDRLADGSSLIEQLVSVLRTIDVVRGAEDGIKPDDILSLTSLLEVLNTNRGDLPAVDIATVDDGNAVLIRSKKQVELQVMHRTRECLCLLSYTNMLST
jgi:hypothetical protein